MCTFKERYDHVRKHEKMLGEGFISKVYTYGDDKVFKVGRKLDVTFDYLMFCWARVQQYGADSPEMAHMPIIHELGFQFHTADTGEPGYYVIMDRYEEQGSMGFGGMPTRFRKFMDDSPIEVSDGHPGNVMWDDRRQQHILTDPGARRSCVSSLCDAGRHMTQRSALERQVSEGINQFLRYLRNGHPGLNEHRAELERYLRAFHPLRFKPISVFKFHEHIQEVEKAPITTVMWDAVPLVKTKRVADWKVPQLQKQVMR